MLLKGKQSSEKLIQKAVLHSHEAFSVFMNVVHQLEEANEQLAVAREQDYKLKQQLEENIERVNQQETRNNNLIEKISHIIGE